MNNFITFLISTLSIKTHSKNYIVESLIKKSQIKKSHSGNFSNPVILILKRKNKILESVHKQITIGLRQNNKKLLVFLFHS